MHPQPSELLAGKPLADLAALRLLLTGESVVDESRIWFADREAVDRFLRLNQFDTDNPLDLARLMDLHRQAVEFLNETHGLCVPDDVAHIDEIHDLFLRASQASGRSQRFACMVLKVIHILHHVAGRELIFTTSISEAQLFDRLSGRVFTVIDRMRAAGIDVLEFSGGKKSRTSLVTKLLAKRSTLASEIFDKARFSVVVRERSDLVPGLLYLANNLFPHNYVVPEQSQNGIVTLGDIASALSLEPQLVWDFWTKGGRANVGKDGAAPTPQNEFSGPDYRCINLAADIPVRIDDVAPSAAPAIAFVQAEVQLFDEKTNASNNEGETAHEQYKKRQYARVQTRLEGPSAVPRFGGKVD